MHSWESLCKCDEVGSEQKQERFKNKRNLCFSLVPHTLSYWVRRFDAVTFVKSKVKQMSLLNKNKWFNCSAKCDHFKHYAYEEKTSQTQVLQ